MSENNDLERLRRLRDRLEAYLGKEEGVYSAAEVERFNMELTRVSDVMADVDEFAISSSAFREAPFQARRQGQIIGSPKPNIVYATDLRDHHAKPALAAVDRLIEGKLSQVQIATLTLEQLGDRYVDACLDVASAVRRLLRAEPAWRGSRLNSYSLRKYLKPEDGMISEARWWSEYQVLVNQAIRDLRAPVVGILDGGGDTAVGRRLIDDREALVRQIASPELETLPAEILRVVRDGSFGSLEPTFMPRQLISDDGITAAVRTDKDNEYSFGLLVDQALRGLHDEGYVDANLFIGGGRVRITMAGIIWLRDHERVTMDETKRQQRVQNNITNYGNLHMGEGDIVTTINNFGTARDPESGMAYLRSLGVPETSLETLPALMADLSDENDEERGSRLSKWVSTTVGDMTVKAADGLASAMGTTAAGGLMHLINNIDWSNVRSF